MTDAVNSAEHPVVPGFHPDPTICRAGDTYYLAHSSFEYSPGVPLWRSTDLTTWEQVGHALDGDENLRPGIAGPGGGVYAPTLRHHAGRFWMITTNVSGKVGQLVTSAPSIEGPWSPGIVIEGAVGIDPDLAWDDEGTCYMTFSSNMSSAPGIAQVRVDLETGTVLDEPRTVSRGTGLAYPEAPHVFRRGDWWYLLYAEGGTERGHTVGIARAKTPTGPFELHPHNPIFTRRSTTFPVQNAGHADLIERLDGSWAMVYLGVRPRGATPQFHVNGRETFLAGIDWVDDWPVVVPDRFTFTPAPTGFTDRFDGPLHPRWTSPGFAPAEIAESTPGGIRIAVEDDAPNGAPSMLATRTLDAHWRFSATTEASEAAAVRVRMDDRHWGEVRIDSGRARAALHIGGLTRTIDDDRTAASGARSLIIESRPATSGGPDDLVFAIADADGERELARLDGRYLSTEVAGGFVGRTVGLRAASTAALFTDVAYEPREAANENAEVHS
ncbi:glycoside hydrolase family 43 protein [Microbacterium sp. LWO13-1.2]|uniref:glycoside hydrolase family 43 protein n=1 Tax=Microbacterium sp. LWO13-1.2 TaxID=3135262 RepID=UPI003139D321